MPSDLAPAMNSRYPIRPQLWILLSSGRMNVANGGGRLLACRGIREAANGRDFIKLLSKW